MSAPFATTIDSQRAFPEVKTPAPHTFLGATLVAGAAAVSGKLAADLALRWVRRATFLAVSWPVAITSALIGTYSHVVLDGIMHSDVEPFAPVSLANPFSGSSRFGCCTNCACCRAWPA